MNDKLTNALEECLRLMEGGASLEEALSRQPDLAEQIRPLLLAAHSAGELDPGAPPAQSLNRGRADLLARVEAARQTGSRRGMSPVLRFGLITAAVVAFLVLSGGGLVAASAKSLPADPLYGVKRTAESIRLGLTFDPAQKTALEEEFQQRRVDETESLLSSQRTVQVNFSGAVESQLADGWQVAGIHVIVTPQTVMVGIIHAGAAVDVEGTTQANDTVVAQKLSLVSGENEGNSGSNSGGSGETGATPSSESGGGEATSQPQSGETPNPEGGSNSGGGSGGGEGSGSPTQVSPSGSGGGGGDATQAPESTRTVESTKTPEPTRTQEPTQ